MFTPIEKKFLSNEVQNFIKHARAHLENYLPDDQREAIEHKLIAALSVFNKLNHKPKDAQKKLDPTRVLIVDDIRSMREINKHLLTEIGFKHIEVSADAKQALQMLRNAEVAKKPFGLVLSDWKMPGMTGLELLKEIRMDNDLCQIPFFLITSVSDKNLIINAINLGATGYITKPINLKILTTKLKEYLNS